MKTPWKILIGIIALAAITITSLAITNTSSLEGLILKKPDYSKANIQTSGACTTSWTPAIKIEADTPGITEGSLQKLTDAVKAGCETKALVTFEEREAMSFNCTEITVTTGSVDCMSASTSTSAEITNRHFISFGATSPKVEYYSPNFGDLSAESNPSNNNLFYGQDFTIYVKNTGSSLLKTNKTGKEITGTFENVKKSVEKGNNLKIVYGTGTELTAFDCALSHISQDKDNKNIFQCNSPVYQGIGFPTYLLSKSLQYKNDSTIITRHKFDGTSADGNTSTDTTNYTATIFEVK